MASLESFFAKNQGLASVSELADELELDEGAVRRWARDHEGEVRRVGNVFVFNPKTARKLIEDLLPERDGDLDADNEAVESVEDVLRRSNDGQRIGNEGGHVAYLRVFTRMLELQRRFGDSGEPPFREGMAFGFELAARAARERGQHEFAKELDESAAALRKGSA